MNTLPISTNVAIANFKLENNTQNIKKITDLSQDVLALLLNMLNESDLAKCQIASRSLSEKIDKDAYFWRERALALKQHGISPQLTDNTPSIDWKQAFTSICRRYKEEQKRFPLHQAEFSQLSYQLPENTLKVIPFNTSAYIVTETALFLTSSEKSSSHLKKITSFPKLEIRCLSSNILVLETPTSFILFDNTTPSHDELGTIPKPLSNSSSWIIQIVGDYPSYVFYGSESNCFFLKVQDLVSAKQSSSPLKPQEFEISGTINSSIPIKLINDQLYIADNTHRLYEYNISPSQPKSALPVKHFFNSCNENISNTQQLVVSNLEIFENFLIIQLADKDKFSFKTTPQEIRAYNTLTKEWARLPCLNKTSSDQHPTLLSFAVYQDKILVIDVARLSVNVYTSKFEHIHTFLTTTKSEVYPGYLYYRLHILNNEQLVAFTEDFERIAIWDLKAIARKRNQTSMPENFVPATEPTNRGFFSLFSIEKGKMFAKEDTLETSTILAYISDKEEQIKDSPPSSPPKSQKLMTYKEIPATALTPSTTSLFFFKEDTKSLTIYAPPLGPIKFPVRLNYSIWHQFKRLVHYLGST